MGGNASFEALKDLLIKQTLHRYQLMLPEALSALPPPPKKKSLVFFKSLQFL